MFYLRPSRPPFSDWLAQVERAVERHSRGTAHLSPDCVGLLRRYYDNNVSAKDAAEDLLS